MRDNIKKVFYFLKGLNKEFSLFIFTICLIYAIEAIFHPILTKLIFDEAVIRKSLKIFFILISSYLFLGIFINLISFFVELWGKSFENKILSKILKKTLMSYYNKDYAYILQKGEGYFIGRVYKDVMEAFPLFISSIRNISTNLTRVIAFTSVLIYISWQATLIMFILIPFIVYFSNLLSQKIKSATLVERETESEFINFLNKNISSYKAVNILNLLGKVLESTIFAFNKYLNALYRNFKIITTYNTGIYLIMNISDFCSLLVGAIFLLKGKMTFGGYLAFVTAFWRSVTAVSQFFAPFAQLNKSLTIINRIYEFEKEEKVKFYKVKDEVILENVCFSYDKNFVFKDFSLRIKKGEKILIKGPNGSGKTTLANIMSGLLKVQSGNVILPPRISSLTLPFEFPLLKIKELPIKEKLLKDFGLMEFVDKYPHELSIGNMQKLAIALIFSKEADLYILDEPLANIDKESTIVLMKHILDLSRDKTLVVIMHKGDEWHQFFDRILDLKENKKEV